MARKKRALDTVELPPWSFIAFTDLHVNAKNIERAVAVLAEVRHLAEQHSAEVVCLGDFWDARGTLSVRQLDSLLDEFERWRAARIPATLIPGNHDQVSVNGTVHGIRVFEPFPNITVATHAVLREKEKIAFLPWREAPEEQAQLFTDLEGEGWTIFAHAEVQGATTNHKYKSPGRVSQATIEAIARACYCGHYHKQQQLGDRTWYIGSPFQHHFGEMDDPPKGVALITKDEVEPAWIELAGFPRHHRLTYGTPFDPSTINDNDVVEVYATANDIDTPEFREFATTVVPASDVRPLPLKADTEEGAPPAFALTLDQALDQYVDVLEAEADAEHEWVADEMKALGRSILSEIPEAKRIVPMATQVKVASVAARDFCALRGEVQIDLDGRGLLMLKGRIGVGKTALTDAITWCLYGQTAPRKAGSHGASLRGDEVIHDEANECYTAVTLDVGGTPVTIERSKKRAKGAKVVIEGTDTPDGIADQQEQINHIVGMDYALWRTTVSLGQGAVGNFLTDADKRRKELLSTTFGLDACPAALKYVRDRIKPLHMQIEKHKIDVLSDRKVVDALKKTDYATQSKQWEEQRAAQQDAAQQAGVEAKKSVEECEALLGDEPKWLAVKKQHDDRLEELTKQLSGMGASEQLSKLERERGGVQSERAMTERDLARARDEATRLEAALEAGPIPCPTCGKPMDAPDAEKHVVDKGNEVKRLEGAIRTFSTKIGNIAAKIEDLSKSGTSERESIEAQIAESRDALRKTGEALTAFEKLRANKVNAERRLAEARATWEREAQQKNPWEAKQAQLAKEVADTEERIATAEQTAAKLTGEVRALEVWEHGFSAKGIPVLVLRTALHELETHANRFMAQLLGGRVYCALTMEGDDLRVDFFENKDGIVRDRRYEQLSGGQRRCAELAFSPFALSEMVFARCGVRVPLLVIDELTTHMGADEKPIVCEILRMLDRDTILVIDHDAAVQGEFDVVYEVTNDGKGVEIQRAA